MQEKEWLEVLEKDHEEVTRLAYADWLEEQEKEWEANTWRRLVREKKQPGDTTGYDSVLGGSCRVRYWRG